MTLISRFAQYAAAFEETYTSDDFSLLDPFFSDDAVYETSGGEAVNNVSEGREAVYAALRGSINSLDRLFPSRTLELLEGPTETGNTVWFKWSATYAKDGLPPLVMEGEETLVYEGDLIRRMEDRFTSDSVERTGAYLAEHAEALKSND